MNKKEIILDIKKIYEKFILKSVYDFTVNDYNGFEKAIWTLKERYNLNDSPFLLLPSPAKDADFTMMNASNDGLSEPDQKSKIEYLKKMKISYEKLKDNSCNAKD